MSLLFDPSMAQKKTKQTKEESVEEDVYQVESILDKRIKKGTIQYKIKWLGYGEADCTWENEANIIDREMIDAYEAERQKNKRKKQPDIRKKPVKEDLKKKQSDEKDKKNNLSVTDETNLIGKKTSTDKTERVNTVDYQLDLGKSIDYVDFVFKNDKDELMGLVRYKDKKQGTLHVSQLKAVAPLSLIDYYESKLVFSQSKEDK